jgi:hypothetical protein
MNATGRHRVQRQVSHLAAFAVHLEVLNPAAVLDVAHLQQHCFFTAQPVIEKNSQYRPVAQPFQRSATRQGYAAHDPARFECDQISGLS